MSSSSKIALSLDLDSFARLGETVPLSKLKELVDLFGCETEFYLTEIASRRASGDWEGITRLSRNMVSVTANLCAVRASELARELERACRNRQKIDSARLLSEMAQACREAREAMDAWLGAQVLALQTTDRKVMRQA